MMTEDRVGMMIMLVPTHIFKKETNHLSVYSLPSMISNFAKHTSNVCKFVLADYCREVDEVDEHQFFGGRQ